MDNHSLFGSCCPWIQYPVMINSRLQGTPTVPLTGSSQLQGTPTVPLTGSSRLQGTPTVPLTGCSLLQGTPAVPLTRSECHAQEVIIGGLVFRRGAATYTARLAWSNYTDKICYNRKCRN